MVSNTIDYFSSQSVEVIRPPITIKLEPICNNLPFLFAKMIKKLPDGWIVLSLDVWVDDVKVASKHQRINCFEMFEGLLHDLCLEPFVFLMLLLKFAFC